MQKQPSLIPTKINPLEVDGVCFQHSISYGNYKDLAGKADSDKGIT